MLPSVPTSPTRNTPTELCFCVSSLTYIVERFVLKWLLPAPCRADSVDFVKAIDDTAPAVAMACGHDALVGRCYRETRTGGRR